MLKCSYLFTLHGNRWWLWWITLSNQARCVFSFIIHWLNFFGVTLGTRAFYFHFLSVMLIFFMWSFKPLFQPHYSKINIFSNSFLTIHSQQNNLHINPIVFLLFNHMFPKNHCHTVYSLVKKGAQTKANYLRITKL